MHFQPHNINKYHVMYTMPYNHKDIKLKFNTQSSHICFLMGSHSVKWWKQCHVTLKSLGIGLVRIPVISVYIEVTDPAQPTHSILFS